MAGNYPDHEIRRKLRKFFDKNPKEKGTPKVPYYNEAAKFAGCSPSFARKFFYDIGYRTIAYKDDVPSLQTDPPEPPLEERIRDHLKRHDIYKITELSDVFDCSIGKIRKAIAALIDHGHNIRVEDDNVLFSKIIPRSPDTKINVRKQSTGFYRFGVVSDNHLCSKYARMDVLGAIYKVFKEEGIDTVYNCGNWVDGEASFNKNDLLVHGMDNQLRYMLANYPKVDGIKTYYVSGDDHEGWWTQREGIDTGRYLMMMSQTDPEFKRDDLIYLGHMEADIILKSKKGETKIRVIHAGGGSSYAVSYAPQKIVESYQSGEKPHVLLIGHYHKASYNYVRGVHVVQAGTTEDQTPFMRKKKLAAHLGGWIIEFSTDDVGAITRFKQEFLPFYDKEFYDRWKYLWGHGKKD